MRGRKARQRRVDRPGAGVIPLIGSPARQADRGCTVPERRLPQGPVLAVGAVPAGGDDVAAGDPRDRHLRVRVVEDERRPPRAPGMRGELDRRQLAGTRPPRDRAAVAAQSVRGAPGATRPVEPCHDGPRDADRDVALGHDPGAAARDDEEAKVRFAGRVAGRCRRGHPLRVSRRGRAPRRRRAGGGARRRVGRGPGHRSGGRRRGTRNCSGDRNRADQRDGDPHPPPETTHVVDCARSRAQNRPTHADPARARGTCRAGIAQAAAGRSCPGRRTALSGIRRSVRRRLTSGAISV